MKSFIEFFTLNEGGRFRDSPNLKHEKDYPMFSIFTDRRDPEFEETTQAVDDNSIKLQNAFWTARREINKIGFPSMHANVVFRTVDDDFSGSAMGSSDYPTSKPKERAKRRLLKHMELNKNFLYNIDEHYQTLVDVIVHEWSHLWMFNHGLEFRRAMDQYHEALINSNIDKVKPDPSLIDLAAFNSSLVKHISDYKKNDNEGVLSQAISNGLDDTLQALGPFYKYVPQTFIDNTAQAIVNKIAQNSARPAAQVAKVIMGMGIEPHIKNFLAKDLKVDPNKKIGDKIKGHIAKKVNFPSAYGLQDSDETFAVAIEKFNQLDPYHKKRIVELMQVR